MVCPLCCCDNIEGFYRDKHRCYQRCLRCELVFVPSGEHISEVLERSEYDLHENQLGCRDYLKFLRRLGDPLMHRMPAFSTGLDFGCGPGPALQQWLIDQGFSVSVFDKFYADDQSVLLQSYDFICATEVVEHLRQPGLTLMALWQKVKPGGCLALMTKRVRDVSAFSRWHYKNDRTHIVFFSELSFHWLANAVGAQLEVLSEDVVFLNKPHAAII